MNRIYAIPDIHARLDLLSNLLDKLFLEENLDLSSDKLIFLGDFCDRGPDTKGVLDLIWMLLTTFPDNVVALKGNHEDMLIDACIKGKDMHYLWCINGGEATLNSFINRNVPDRYIKFLDSLPYIHGEPGFFFSHSCVPKENIRHVINKGQPYTKHELTWTRTRNVKDEQNISNIFPNGIVGVCGHNHALRYDPPILAPRFYDNYIFADAGCGCSYKAPLVAVEVTTRKVVYSWP